MKKNLNLISSPSPKPRIRINKIKEDKNNITNTNTNINTNDYNKEIKYPKTTNIQHQKKKGNLLINFQKKKRKSKHKIPYLRTTIIIIRI